LETSSAASLERFLDLQVTTNTELDVILLFLAEPDRSWSPEIAAHRLVLPIDVCRTALECLRERGLLTVRDAEGYWFAPASAELALGAARLWKAYRDSPVEVLRLLNQRALERIRRGAWRTFLDSLPRSRSSR
jgi:hypothetical protein